MGLSFIPVFIVLLVWEAVSRSGIINPLLFPPPSTVAHALWELTSNGIMLWDITVSLWRILAGLSAGVLTGLMCGLLTGRMRTVDRMVSPVIHTLSQSHSQHFFLSG